MQFLLISATVLGASLFPTCQSPVADPHRFDWEPWVVAAVPYERSKTIENILLKHKILPDGISAHHYVSIAVQWEKIKLAKRLLLEDSRGKGYKIIWLDPPTPLFPRVRDDPVQEWQIGTDSSLL